MLALASNLRPDFTPTGIQDATVSPSSRSASMIGIPGQTSAPSSRLSREATIGISLGVLGRLTLLELILFFVYRYWPQKRNKQGLHHEGGTTELGVRSLAVMDGQELFEKRVTQQS